MLSLEVGDVCTLKCDSSVTRIFIQLNIPPPVPAGEQNLVCLPEATEENLGKAINSILYGRIIFINCLRTCSTC